MKKLLLLALLLPLTANAGNVGASTGYIQATSSQHEVTMAFKDKTEGEAYLTYGTGVLLDRYKVMVVQSIPSSVAGYRNYWISRTDTYVFAFVGAGYQYPLINGVSLYFEGNYRVISDGSDGVEYTTGLRFKF